MATTTTTLADLTYATELERDIQRELRPHRGFREVLRQGPKGASDTFTFTTVDDEAATGGYVQSISEGSTDLIDGTLLDVDTTGTTATAAQIGIIALVTDLVKEVSIIDVAPLVASVLSDTLAEKYDRDAQAVIDNGANATGGSTTNTLARMLTVISALEQRDVGSRGETLVGMQHPKQIGDLRADASSLTAGFLAGENQGVNETLGFSGNGFFGAPFGVPIFHSTSVSSASSAYQGWIQAQGAACGAYELWNGKLGMQRDESKLSDEVIVSMAVGFALIDDNRLQMWRSTT